MGLSTKRAHAALLRAPGHLNRVADSGGFRHRRTRQPPGAPYLWGAPNQMVADQHHIPAPLLGGTEGLILPSEPCPQCGRFLVLSNIQGGRLRGSPATAPQHHESAPHLPFLKGQTHKEQSTRSPLLTSSNPPGFSRVVRSTGSTIGGLLARSPLGTSRTSSCLTKATRTSVYSSLDRG